MVISPHRVQSNLGELAGRTHGFVVASIKENRFISFNLQLSRSGQSGRSKVDLWADDSGILLIYPRPFILRASSPDILFCSKCVEIFAFTGLPEEQGTSVCPNDGTTELDEHAITF